LHNGCSTACSFSCFCKLIHYIGVNKPWITSETNNDTKQDANSKRWAAATALWTGLARDIGFDSDLAFAATEPAPKALASSFELTTALKGFQQNVNQFRKPDFEVQDDPYAISSAGISSIGAAAASVSVAQPAMYN
jgi:lipopolysaccharide biosynthesis glycosyltransferase